MLMEPPMAVEFTSQLEKPPPSDPRSEPCAHERKWPLTNRLYAQRSGLHALWEGIRRAKILPKETNLVIVGVFTHFFLAREAYA